MIAGATLWDIAAFYLISNGSAVANASIFLTLERPESGMCMWSYLLRTLSISYWQTSQEKIGANYVKRKLGFP